MKWPSAPAYRPSKRVGATSARSLVQQGGTRVLARQQRTRRSRDIEQEILDTTRMTELTQEVMIEKARAGKCVIVGRGAACALHGIPGCFHTFVYASTATEGSLV